MTTETPFTLPTLHVANFSPFSRRNIGRCGIAIPRGIDLECGKAYLASVGSEHLARVIASGVRRADGFAAHGELSFDVHSSAPGRQALAVTLTEKDGQLVTWNENDVRKIALHPWVFQGLASLSYDLELDGERFALQASAAHNDAFHWFTAVRGRARDRDGADGFWARLTLQTEHDSPVMRWELRAGYNTQETTALETDVFDGLRIRFRGPAVVAHYAQNRSTRVQRQSQETVVDLGGVGVWPDSNGVVATGALLFLPEQVQVDDLDLDKAADDLYLSTILSHLDGSPFEVATDGWDGAFGPCGGVPTIAAEDPAAAATDVARVHLTRMPSDAGLFAWPGMICNETPSDSGDQPDFGLAQLLPIASTGRPDGLYPARLAAMQEGVRPGHYVEEDAMILRWTDHPGWFCWQHQTHYHPSYNRDRLGKPGGTSQLSRSHRGGAWKGHDSEHESINTLCAFALLSREFWARELVEEWCEVALATYAVDSDTYLDGIGMPRAFGRSLLALLNAYNVTGRADVLKRASDRFHVEYLGQAFSRASVIPLDGCEQPPSDGQTHVVRMSDSGPMRAIEMREEVKSPLFLTRVMAPDGRTVPVDNWSPWQESFVAQGLYALYHNTGDYLALSVANQVAETIMLHGVLERPDGSFRIGGYLSYNGGQPLDASAWDDRDQVNAYGDQVRKWLYPAAQIVRAHARIAQPVTTGALYTAQKFARWCEMNRSGLDASWDELTPWQCIEEA